MNKPTGLCLLLFAGLLLTGCTTPAQPPPTAPEPTGTVEPGATTSPPGQTANGGQVIASGLHAPWSIVFAGDTPLISERDTGRILELDENGNARELGRLKDVVHGGEGGLLGLALHGTDQLYAYSTGPNGNRIQRFTLQGQAGGFELSAPETMLDALPAGVIHNGGRLAFGPDGMLYAAVGDAGNRALAQDLESLGGKILRMTPDGGVPADNPFPDSLVYSYGHRNVQGLAWDKEGVMYASEFGQNTWDELNVITPGTNYGWPEVEGIADAGTQFRNPIAQWPTDQASPSGIAVKDGTLYLANLRGERLRSVDLSNPENQGQLWVGEHGRFRDITLSPGNRLWALTNNTDGRGNPAPGDDRLLVVDPGRFTQR